MKKTILLIAVVLAAGVVSGQKTFTFGPKVGINIADLYASSAENTRDLNGTKPSLIVGAFAEYRALKWLAVSADVLYSRQGSTDKATWTERGPGGGFVTESEEFSYRLNYLNIPILANFYVTKGLALKAGIQPGFLIGSKLRVRSNDGPWETADLKDENLFRTTDIAIPVGPRLRTGNRRPLQLLAERHRDRYVQRGNSARRRRPEKNQKPGIFADSRLEILNLSGKYFQNRFLIRAGDFCKVARFLYYFPARHERTSNCFVNQSNIL